MLFSGRWKPCPSSGNKHVRHRDVLFLHGMDDLVRLGLLDARVVAPLADQQRPFDAVGERQRRTLR